MGGAYDLAVIGGGSGGLACAQRAADHGARVLLAEPGPLGGTCVNVGCVPKKLMYNAASLAHALEDAPDYGFQVEVGPHDWPALKRARDAYVRRLNGIYAGNLERRGIRLVRQAARLAGPGRVQAGDQAIDARHIVIATGGRPIVPDLPGAGAAITSDGFFELERCPRTVAIVGSGYIAAELAGMLAALGAKVTVALRHDRMLRSFDEMLSTSLMDSMRADDITILDHAVPRGLVAAGGGHQLEFADGRSAGPFDTVIWAVGRSPNTAGLGLEETGIAVGDAGFVTTDELQDTAVASVHAIGDVTGRAALTPVAIAAGRRLADRLFGGMQGRRLDYRMVPTVIFSHPPIGTVGLTEHEARAAHGEGVSIFRSGFVPLYHALTQSKRRAEMKLVTTGPERRIAGLHVIGAGADEMLQGFAVAVRMGATKQDFDDTIAIHPTSAEEFVTMT